MIMQQATFFLLMLFASLLGSGNARAAGAVQLTMGTEYTSGKYGGQDKTEIWYLPLMAKYAVGPCLLKVTIPYLRITGPGNTTALNSPLANKTQQRTASGPGDIIAGLSYALYENPASGVMFDLTGNIKFGTADKDQGLGTGGNDYAILVDLSKQVVKWGMFTGLGWKIMGSTPDLTLKDTWYGSTGVTYKIASRTTGGLVYDYRGEVVDGGSKVSEATVFVSQKISPNSKIQCYFLKGFSSASADMGGGIALSLQFD
jgi:hypothetical protein